MKGRKGRRTPGHSGDTDWTIDRARRNTGRLTQNNLLLVKLLFFDEKKMLMESKWILKEKLSEEVHFTSPLLFKS